MMVVLVNEPFERKLLFNNKKETINYIVKQTLNQVFEKLGMLHCFN